jgi:diguanylate cyclase (GGDEF)-like protein
MSAALVQMAALHVACAAVGAVAVVTSTFSAVAVLVTLYASVAAGAIVLADVRGMRMRRRMATLLALASMVLAGMCGGFGLVPLRSFGLLFVLTFVWLGLHHPPRLALRLLPIGIGVYVVSASAGAGPAVDVRGVVLMAVVCGVACSTVGLLVQRADATERAFRLVSEVASGLPGASHRQVLDRVVHAVSGLGYAGASLSIVDRRSGIFRVEHSEGVAAGRPGADPLRSLAVEVRDAGSPVVVDDLRQSIRNIPDGSGAGIGTCVGVPVYARSELAGVLVGCHLTVRRKVTRTDLDALVMLAAAAGTALEAARTLAVEQQLTHRLQHIAETDPLTGVVNRRGASALLENLRRGDTVAVLDLDHFKRVNDELGHQAGDRTLVLLAAHLDATLRRTDHIVRIGGEEFLVILPGTSIADAEALMQRVRESWARRSPHATMSVGVAPFRTSSTDTVAAADRAMYAAKAAGRNAVRTSADAVAASN